MLSSRYRNTRFLFKRYEVEQIWANTALVGYTNADLETRFKIKRRREQE
jgi:hypothetical protein